MAKFIGQTGLIYLWTKIKALVATKHDVIDANNKLSADLIADGVTNKTYTATEQAKLAAIEAGAEINQNAFGNVKVGSYTLVADGKTDTFEIAAGDNITLTADTTNDKVTIAAATVTPANVAPLMDGTATIGTSVLYARQDHVHPSDTTKIGVDEKGAANGVCPLNANSLIDSQYLPSYVDDIIEAYIREGQTTLSSTWLAVGGVTGTVITPESGKIYVLMNHNNDYPENTQFRWGGTEYVKLNDGGISELTTTEMDSATQNWT